VLPQRAINSETGLTDMTFMKPAEKPARCALLFSLVFLVLTWSTCSNIGRETLPADSPPDIEVTADDDPITQSTATEPEPSPCTANRSDYPFADTGPTEPLRCRLAPPAGYTRVTPPDDFAAWLRELPLKAPEARVMTFSGREATLSERLFAYNAGVVDMQLLNENQQCADAIMRLRAEYLWTTGDCNQIEFTQARMTISYRDWDSCSTRSRPKFEKYLKYVFAFIGTAGLKDELQKIDKGQVFAGDLHVQNDTGGIGHALLVLDHVKNAEGRSLYLLGQGSIPALEFHIVRLPDHASAWTDLGAIERHYSFLGESVYRRFE
jgi:Domain of unknown function (4846)